MLTLAATTNPDATTHSHSLAWLVTAAVIALVILTIGYGLKCWLFPFTTCHHTTPGGALRCRHCEGTGRRVRAGRRLLHHIRAAHRHH